MNWRRGTLRLVIVASICWSGVAAWVLYQNPAIMAPRRQGLSDAEKRVCVDARTADPSLGNPFACYVDVKVLTDAEVKSCTDARKANPSLGNLFDCFGDVGPPLIHWIWVGIFKLIVLPVAGAFLAWAVMVWAVSGFLPKTK
jgi:hypothetical protein